MGTELCEIPAIKRTVKHKQSRHEQIESSMKPRSNHSDKLNALDNMIRLGSLNTILGQYTDI